MLYSLTGKLVCTDYDSAVVDCGGVAYCCKTTYTTLKKISGESRVCLYTHLSVREDGIDLYGFADREELKCFRLLISVSGVGPKAALAILSEMDPQRFALCAATDDVKSLTMVKGIGAKTAQRIILELKDKLVGETLSVRGSSPVPPPAEGSAAAEAITALQVLGYSSAEAAAAVSSLDPSLSVEELIKKALIALARF